VEDLRHRPEKTRKKSFLSLLRFADALANYFVKYFTSQTDPPENGPNSTAGMRVQARDSAASSAFACDIFDGRALARRGTLRDY
jgi:hypothetical protein